MGVLTRPLVAAEGEQTCGVVVTGGTGIEWVCVRPVHTTAADLRDRGPLDPHGAAWEADRHYFRNRYPHRPHDQG